MRSVAIAAALLCASCASEPCRLEYGSCSGADDCSSGQCQPIEWPYGAGSICARECESELDCPSTTGQLARCIDVERNGRFLCHPDCTNEPSCPAGWVCQPIRSNGVVSAICLP